MIKKILFISMMCLTAITGKAQQDCQITDSLIQPIKVSAEQLMQPLTPTYLENVSEAANWGRNWFIDVKGGASAFLGTPIGCGDVFDRLTPTLQVGVGKWFTPAVGGRVGYQGLSFKNAEFSKMEYHFVHADFMYNCTAFVGQNDLGLSRWDVIPFIGVGMIYNADWSNNCTCVDRTSGSHPFAFSYGIEARYRITNHMHLVAELSGLTTSKRFDGIGKSGVFGDNMLSVSAGLSFTLGKPGFRRVVDAYPYMKQNARLLDYASEMEYHNLELTKREQEHEQVLQEYRKILEIEGLLDVYADKLSKMGSGKLKSLYPRNDYSGLNSLRARMNNRGWNNDAVSASKASNKRLDESYKNPKTEMADTFDLVFDDKFFGYNDLMLQGKVPVGAPVYFFFNLGTDQLTDEAQLLNIEGLANVAKKYKLKITVIGAADSSTGTEAINNVLSSKRAGYIKRLICERGVPVECIETSHKGGIDDYSPVQANRNTCVILSFSR